MGENLSMVVKNLRRELDKLTGIYIQKQHEESTAFMVQSQAIKAEIDALESFVISGYDRECVATLRRKMSQYLDLQETKTLIHDYGISDFEYVGNTISGIHIELIRFCERRDILPDLINALRDSRPRVHWPDC